MNRAATDDPSAGGSRDRGRAAAVGREGTTVSAGDEAGPQGLLRWVFLGLIGGAYATMVMTAFRMPISHSLPPTANFWAHYFGDGDPEEYPVPAFLLHVVYGIVGGGIFGLLHDRRVGRTRAGMEAADLARGLGFGLVFSTFGSRIVLGRLVGMDLETDEALIFHVGHAIYGIALGAWVGSNR